MAQTKSKTKSSARQRFASFGFGQEHGEEANELERQPSEHHPHSASAVAVAIHDAEPDRCRVGQGHSEDRRAGGRPDGIEGQNPTDRGWHGARGRGRRSRDQVPADG